MSESNTSNTLQKNNSINSGEVLPNSEDAGSKKILTPEEIAKSMNENKENKGKKCAAVPYLKGSLYLKRKFNFFKFKREVRPDFYTTISKNKVHAYDCTVPLSSKELQTEEVLKRMPECSYKELQTKKVLKRMQGYSVAQGGFISSADILLQLQEMKSTSNLSNLYIPIQDDKMCFDYEEIKSKLAAETKKDFMIKVRVIFWLV